MIAVRHHRYFETCSCDLEINLGKPLKRVHNWISGSSTEEKDEKCLYSRSFEMYSWYICVSDQTVNAKQRRSMNIHVM